MKGKQLKDKKIAITANGKEYKLALDMNALCELEDIYGDTKVAIGNFKEKPIKTVRSFIYAMLKSQDEKITLMKAGALIDTKNFNQVIDAITELIEEAFPENEETDEEDIEAEVETKNE